MRDLVDGLVKGIEDKRNTWGHTTTAKTICFYHLHKDGGSCITVSDSDWEYHAGLEK